MDDKVLIFIQCFNILGKAYLWSILQVFGVWNVFFFLGGWGGVGEACGGGYELISNLVF